MSRGHDMQHTELEAASTKVHDIALAHTELCAQGDVCIADALHEIASTDMTYCNYVCPGVSGMQPGWGGL